MAQDLKETVIRLWKPILASLASGALVAFVSFLLLRLIASNPTPLDLMVIVDIDLLVSLVVFVVLVYAGHSKVVIHGRAL